jgi:serine protease Do
MRAQEQPQLARAQETIPELAAHAPPPRTVLKPVPASRKALAAGFNQVTPGSIAELRAMEQHIEELVPRLTPAVVAVEVGYATGSGVVISADGLVLTAGHVSGRPNRDVQFTFPDGRKARGKTLGAESDSDTGLMQITGDGPWPHVPVGELDQARIGDWVLALGHPGGFDLGRSPVVRLGRIIRLMPGVIQTDCTISPGDSGGPLFDMHGRVVGIHTSISSSLAENFHVPITEYADTWDQLVKAQTSSENELWASMVVGAETTDEGAGCRVSVVEKNGPAFKAGLKVGDLILKVEGREIRASASFRRWVAESKPGETITVEVKRRDQMLSLPLKPEAAPPRH